MIDIINYLIKDLPSDIDKSRSVIAGGAVANLLYNKQHNKNAPVNDIDIFVFNQRTTPKENNNLDGAIDDYIDGINSEFNNNLKILKTTRNGIFNIIEVEVDYIFDLGSLLVTLLERFDINATQAGIRLDNNQLITLPEYDEFLKTCQIKAINTNTPVKTILRLLKKKKEFECYFDDNQIKILFQFSRFKNSKMTSETVEKFKDQIDYCKDYFRVFKMSGDVWKVFLNRDKHNLKLHRNEKKLIKSQNNKLLLPLFEAYYSQSKLYNKYLKIRPYQRTLSAYLSHDLFNNLKQDFNESKLVNLEKTLRKVQVLNNYFSKLSVRDSIDQAVILERIENPEFKLYILGLLATQIFPLDNESLLEFIKLNEKKFLDSLEPLAMPLEYSSFKKIKELLTDYSLRLEGSRMGHCVGGYGAKIKRGDCRIFSIETEEGLSTIEIASKKISDTETLWYGIQHRGKFNKLPPQKNRELAVEFLNHLTCPNKLLSPELSPAGDYFF